MSVLPIKKYTLKEYFQIEKSSNIKHDYVYGEIFSMVGASRNHLRLTTNITTELQNQIRSSTCETFGSDARIKTSDYSYRYSDVVVACNAQFETFEGLDSLINPVLIVEVLSKSTARFDRDTKFREYQQVESLRYYLLISQTEVGAMLFIRNGDNWTSQNYNNLSSVIELPAINSRLIISEIYLRVEF
ncbi:MAG: Uma2 family endonuclease [Acidobacteria bacterium]|nr:Uma2 family endonuclease [Acidobacteriota bacterium]